VKVCARQMAKHNKGGRIICISSANAEIAGVGGSAYCGTKAAVRMMTRCWAQDLVPFGITVNCIGPGATQTALMVAQVDDDQAVKSLLEAIPMGRMATPEEISYLCAYYCSDEAAYLTGTYVLQDGGLRDHTTSSTPDVRRVVAQRASLTGQEVLAGMDATYAKELDVMKTQRSKHKLQ